MKRLPQVRAIYTLAICVGLFLAANTQAGAAENNALSIEAVKARIQTEGSAQGRAWNLFSAGDVGDYLQFAAGGQYEVVVRAHGSAAGGVWPAAALKLDENSVRAFRVAKSELDDYRATIEILPGLHILAVAFTNDAVIGDEDRNLYLERITVRGLDGQPAPQPGNPADWAVACEKRERDVLARAAANIEKIRKGDAVIEVRDSKGRPVTDAAVEVEQVGHEFLFGCNIYMFDRFRIARDNDEYKRRFAELFNYATTGFYWRPYERERGKPQYDYTDKVVAWARERGIRLKGHPILWGNKSGVPLWSNGQPDAAARKARVEDILKRYRGKIEFWEVVNEPAHERDPKVAESYPWAREADPSGTLIINDYHVLADGYPPFFKLLQDAIAGGVPFDGIGIQAHEPLTMRFPLDQAWRYLDQYATLGKPLHVTEFTPLSSGRKITGSWKEGVWDEAAQAGWAEQFYRACFGHPAVMAITWWDLCDRGAWQKGGGMLREDLSPKPVYDALKRLIHEEWKTKTSGKTDKKGEFRFRGYYGAYRIKATAADGSALQTDFRLEKGSQKPIVATLSRR